MYRVEIKTTSNLRSLVTFNTRTVQHTNEITARARTSSAGSSRRLLQREHYDTFFKELSFSLNDAKPIRTDEQNYEPIMSCVLYMSLWLGWSGQPHPTYWPLINWLIDWLIDWLTGSVDCCIKTRETRTCNWLILGIGLWTPDWFKLTNANLPDLKCNR